MNLTSPAFQVNLPAFFPAGLHEKSADKTAENIRNFAFIQNVGLQPDENFSEIE
jgi:hypothetical protein